jgi:hypothetical protein
MLIKRRARGKGDRDAGFGSVDPRVAGVSRRIEGIEPCQYACCADVSGTPWHVGLVFRRITRRSWKRALREKKILDGGTHNQGRMTSPIGGGVKRRYRVIDFKSDKFGVPAKVFHRVRPDRSARASRCCTT